MKYAKISTLSELPSVDQLLNTEGLRLPIARYGRHAVTQAIRHVLSEIRKNFHKKNKTINIELIILRVLSDLENRFTPSLKKVFNLTGTVLHTNLGRAALPKQAINEVVSVAAGATNLEFDITTGKRGERESHVDHLLTELTGAEAATIVNNNAAAVLVILNTFALGKKVPVSRGELVEIGGSFRIPDIMTRAGAILVEVGTTNRTHLHDFANVTNRSTGMIMKVHTSNYTIEGFTSSVPEEKLADLCHQNEIPFAIDLGSGSIIDFTYLGLPNEQTPKEALATGADIVAFSGDKLLGGPQSGIIVGSKQAIEKIRNNPMKRALRPDKMTIAALASVLRLYKQPETLIQNVPCLRILSRKSEEIFRQGKSLIEPIRNWVGHSYLINLVQCKSQIGSGAMPTAHLPSAAAAIKPSANIKNKGRSLKNIAERFRALPIPVIGRIENGLFLLDFRCLEDSKTFISQLEHKQ